MYCAEIVANFGIENDPNSKEIYNLFYTFLDEISKAEKKEQKIREAEKSLEGYKRQLFGEGSAIESEYTMQQLMGIYIQARVEYGIDRMSNHMSDTILSNNIGLHNIIWVYNEFLNAYLSVFAISPLSASIFEKSSVISANAI